MATRNLYKGCTGSDVKTLQKKLKKLGYYQSGAVDGIFGSMTDTAVRQFQRAAGIKVDGIVGPQTRSALSGKLKKKKKKVVKKKTTKKKTKNTNTHEMGRWNGHKFVISPKKIYSFTGLQVKGSSELKDKKDSGQGKVARKGGNPTEVSMTIPINAFTGCDVRAEAMAFVNEARAGKKDYFYVGSKKLVSCKLMLTDATVKEVEITAKGKWKYAEVQVTMKQCNKGGKSSSSGSSSKSKSSGSSGSSGRSSGSSGGSNKVSVRNSTPTTTKKTTWVQKAANTVKTALQKFGTKIKNALSGKTTTSSTAKKVTSATATIKRLTTTANKSTGGGGTRCAMTR